LENVLPKKQTSLMILLLSAVYFISYLTRINYAAVLLEIVRSEGISKELASLALTGSAITYGVGQLISGYLGDKIKPYFIIAFGLFVASVTNLLIPLVPSAGYMTVVWCFNGLAQSMLWPPMIKIMAGIFDRETYIRACVRVSWASSVATIFIYLFAPAVIHFSTWKTVFYFCAACGILMCFTWIFVMRKNEKTVSPPANTYKDVEKQPFSPNIVLILFFLLIVIILQGALRDGVTNWMPTYISETFNLGSEISILTSVALPLFSILCYQVASYLNRRLIKNEMLGGAVIFSAAFSGAFILALTGGKSVAVSIITAALITGSMHGVNFLLVGILPRYFAKFGKLSFISGLLNSCTYVGSAVSTYGIALLSDKMGWIAITWFWSITALVGVLICIGTMRPWEKFKKTI